MEKKHKIKTFFGIAILSVLGSIILVGSVYLISSYSEKKSQNPNLYNAYLPYDYHLESTQSGDFLGSCERNVDYTGYLFSYWNINGLSNSQFVVASKRLSPPMGLMSSTSYHVLQNPENMIDVLQEWNIKEIQLCHLESSKLSKGNIMTDASYSLIEVNNDSTVIREFCDLTNVKSLNTYKSFDATGFKKINYAHLCITFNETDALMWVCGCEIYQSSMSGEYIVTLDLGLTQGFQEDSYSVAIDRCKELQNFILKAFELK